MSRELTRRHLDHLILERGRAGEAWRKRPWESLRLQTPNWANGLPGAPDPGPDHDGFLPARAFAGRLEHYAAQIEAPIREQCTVLTAKAHETGFLLLTDHGEFQCQFLVIATGACAQPRFPTLSSDIPKSVDQLTAAHYSVPGDLREGGVLVVGASASGVQIASELQASGRQVTLAVGNHLRLPRQYRGRDIEWWLDLIGALDDPIDDVDDLERVRRAPSPQITGHPNDVSLGALVGRGVEIVGRLATVRDGCALFSGGLAHVCNAADLKLERLRQRIDTWAVEHVRSAIFPAADPLEATPVPIAPRLDLALYSGEVSTIVWATGFRPDHSWLHLPVFDRRGRLAHDGGVVRGAPGLYVLGLPFLRRRRSALISGAGPDAHDLAEHLEASLRHRIAA